MEVEYRQITEADLGAFVDVMNQSNRELKHYSDTTPDEMRTWLFGDKDFDPKAYLVAFAGGRAVAHCGTIVQKSRLDGGYSDAHISLSVAPEWRDKGLEKRLLDHLFGYLRSRGIRYARTWVPDYTAWRNEIAKSAGMNIIRYGYHMIYDSMESPKSVPAPEGYTFARKRLEEATDAEIADFVNALNDSFQDHWSFSPIEVERMIKARDEVRKKREDISGLISANRGNEIAGIGMYTVPLSSNKQKNKKVGWTSMLGVRKTHRRRGLGRALLSQTMVSLRKLGMAELRLGVDGENSKALTLYKSMGYKVDGQNALYEVKL
jgi:ribosomal protein S18 acetylase RimI-like enzyme